MAPALACVDWAADHLDALVLVALLRSEGIDAFLPDENLVRQNWLHVFAFGGFRVLARSADAARAADLLARYRSGRLAIDEAAVEHPACPRCSGECTVADPRPRRQVFVAFLLSQVAAYALMFVDGGTGANALVVVTVLVLPGLAQLAPGLLRWHVLRRYRCDDCANRWRASARPGFAQLQRDAQT
ncbi:MAG: hypothetical protein J0L88_03685 [Xanthomonadales bacterium]|nr:hypothetical protein [Xanthomonadales bacterium]